MTIDWTIGIGQIGEAFGFLIVGVLAFAAIRSDVRSLRESQRYQAERLGGVEIEVKKLTEIVVSSARLDERVTRMREDLTAVGLRVTALEVSRATPH